MSEKSASTVVQSAFGFHAIKTCMRKLLSSLPSPPFPLLPSNSSFNRAACFCLRPPRRNATGPVVALFRGGPRGWGMVREISKRGKLRFEIYPSVLRITGGGEEEETSLSRYSTDRENGLSYVNTCTCITLRARDDEYEEIIVIIKRKRKKERRKRRTAATCTCSCV